MRKMIRAQMVNRDETPGPPFEASFIKEFPRTGDQIVSPDMRAFSVSFVEWRYDLDEVHIFCVEFPNEAPPNENNN
jgi:hypothetical protein